MTEIHFNNPLHRPSLPALKPKATVSESATPSSTDKPAQSTAAPPSSWVERLEGLPEIRPEAIARGKALLADPNYPDAVVAARMAETLFGEPLS